ncbi:MAG TPA: hypothetical protein VFL79_19640 [Terriglobia bacterium]|nr:hypothetical protein [Terriglobia bacterium]
MTPEQRKEIYGGSDPEPIVEDTASVEGVEVSFEQEEEPEGPEEVA